MNRFGPALLAFGAASALVACQPQRDLIADQATVTLSPVDRNPAVMSVRIKGGPTNTQLLSVIAPSAISAEIHRTVRDPSNGVVRMEPAMSVPIPANKVVWLKPGGAYHIMLFGVNLVARRLGEMDVTLIFATGERIIVTAKVVKAGSTS